MCIVKNSEGFWILFVISMGAKGNMIGNRLKKVVFSTLLTSLISMVFFVIPLVLIGGVIYSVVMNPVPATGKFVDYLKHIFFMILSGVLGWIGFTYLVYGETDFSNLYMVSFLTFVYYTIYLFINNSMDK